MMSMTWHSNTRTAFPTIQDSRLLIFPATYIPTTSLSYIHRTLIKKRASEIVENHVCLPKCWCSWQSRRPIRLPHCAWWAHDYSRCTLAFIDQLKVQNVLLTGRVASAWSPCRQWRRPRILCQNTSSRLCSCRPHFQTQRHLRSSWPSRQWSRWA